MSLHLDVEVHIIHSLNFVRHGRSTTSEPGLALFYNGEGSSLFIGRGRPGCEICESFGLREWSRDR